MGAHAALPMLTMDGGEKQCRVRRDHKDNNAGQSHIVWRTRSSNSFAF